MYLEKSISTRLVDRLAGQAGAAAAGTIGAPCWRQAATVAIDVVDARGHAPRRCGTCR